ncbi:hypothetical protein ACI6Q2_13465 [Chitinophagaceae bacterium LWZ2-11]
MFISSLLVLNISAVKAQNVEGSWYGVGAVQMPGGNNSYLSEIILKQKGKTVKGELNYYFRDSLFRNKIEGTYDEATRVLTLKQLPIIFYKSVNTALGVDCPMTGIFTLRVSKTGSVLAGRFFTDDDHKYTCPPISLSLTKGDSTSLKRLKEEIAIEELPKKDTLPTVVVPIVAPKTATELQFDKREKVYLQQLEIVESSIKVELYDNGQIDYDSVTLFFNNKMVLPETMLTHTAIKITLQLDKTLEFNELSMFANNVGTIPPNTAAMIIYDGTKRYEIMMTSDLDNTATIKLVRKKP